MQNYKELTHVTYPVIAYKNFGISPERYYKAITKRTKEYAVRINRELAEGPTHFLPDNYYGPVEMWPLVMTNG